MEIAHNKPSFDHEEQAAAQAVLQSGFVAQGPHVEKFEAEFCEYLGLGPDSAVALSSGTGALLVALTVMGARGKRVGFPAYACTALRNGVAFAGAEELLCDVADDSPNVDIDVLSRSAADLFVVPHLYGIPADISSLPAERLIEDCAHALGAKQRGRYCGLSGKVAIFSFYATKLISSGGQGGMLVSQDAAVIAEARDFREFDQKNDRRKRFNLQMTDLQAAIGRVQLKKLPRFLERRSEIFGRYTGAGVKLLGEAAGAQCAPVRYRAVLRHDRPDELIAGMRRRGIHCIIPIEEREILGNAAEFPKAQALSRSTVSIPLYPALTNGEADRVVEGLGI